MLDITPAKFMITSAAEGKRRGMKNWLNSFKIAKEIQIKRLITKFLDR